MIPNQWYIVMDSGQVKRSPVGVTRMGERLVLWRDGDGQVRCFRDCCVHRGVALSVGKVLESGRLQCPFHGFEYDGTGKVTRIPANGKNMPVPDRFHVHGYPTHEAYGYIWIWWGEDPPETLSPPSFFTGIDDTYTYGRLYDHWDAHYSRVIENQLDVVHLPFIHHNTIGRGNRTLVDGPVVDWVDENHFNVYTHNRVDDGSNPRLPRQLPTPDPENDFRVGFIFPNLWENYLSRAVRLVVAFVPVDNERTILHLHMYQNLVRTPGMRELMNGLMAPFNRLILRQDRRVVVTQQPKASALRMDEQLIQGDHPIVAYRRRRQALLDAARSSINE